MYPATADGLLKSTLTVNVPASDEHVSMRQFAGQVSGGSVSTVRSSVVLPSSQVSPASTTPFPQTAVGIVVVVVDSVLVVVVGGAVVVVLVVLVAIVDVVVGDVAVVVLDDAVVVVVVTAVEDEVVGATVVVVVVAVVDVVDSTDVVVVEDVEVETSLVVVVVDSSGQGCNLTLWKCFFEAENVPTRLAPLFACSSPFGAQISRRTSAPRWMATTSPATKS